MTLESPTLYAEYADTHARVGVGFGGGSRLVSQNEFYAALAPPTATAAATVASSRASAPFHMQTMSTTEDDDDGGRPRGIGRGIPSKS